MDRRHEYGVTFALTVVHVALLSVGFLILADQFSFPEILRVSSQERLALFSQNQGLIVPAYYMMGMSGLTQIALAVMFHQSFSRAGSTVLVAALVAGVLAGAFQMMGFMRWPIAVPYLAEQMASAPTPEMRNIVGLLEGLLNRYAGMVVGEHLGFLGQGIWTFLIGIAMLRGPLFAFPYGLIGMVLGVAIGVSSLEQLGGPFEAIGMLSAPASAAWLGWLLMCGVSLLRTRADGVGPKFFLFSALGMVIVMGALVAPAMG
ncbi:MAG: DUF4386 domain-containing protein [Alphaproteobacteria bacterium]|nr:DUF4386 domain-containing protein [Alphaproteobacteria bacterium]